MYRRRWYIGTKLLDFFHVRKKRINVDRSAFFCISNRSHSFSVTNYFVKCNLSRDRFYSLTYVPKAFSRSLTIFQKYSCLNTGVCNISACRLVSISWHFVTKMFKLSRDECHMRWQLVSSVWQFPNWVFIPTIFCFWSLTVNIKII